MAIRNRAGFAQRLSGPRAWGDPRFGIGLVLIVVSVVATSVVVAAADSSVSVYAARGVLSVGDVVTAGDLIESKVRVGDARALYLVPGDVPANGIVVTKAVDAGELVPASAVGTTAGLDFTTVMIPVGGALASSLDAGAVADVWSSAQGADRLFGPPVVIVPAAGIVRVVTSDGIVVDDSGVDVEVLVPRSRVARLLEAVANEDALSLVPVALPVKG